MKDVLNMSKEKAKAFIQTIKANNGYCPCSLIKDEDHKCKCKEFREQTEGVCHCGLYKKIQEKQEE